MKMRRKKRAGLTQAQLNRWYDALEGNSDEEFTQVKETLAVFRGNRCVGMCCLGVFLHVNDDRPWRDKEHGQSVSGQIGGILDPHTWGELFDNTFPLSRLKTELRKQGIDFNAYSSQKVFALLNDDKNFTFTDIAKLARKVARK